MITTRRSFGGATMISVHADPLHVPWRSPIQLDVFAITNMTVRINVTWSLGPAFLLQRSGGHTTGFETAVAVYLMQNLLTPSATIMYSRDDHTEGVPLVRNSRVNTTNTLS